MIENQRIVFDFSDEDYEELQKFKKLHEICEELYPYGHLEYSFLQAPAGYVGKVKCKCGSEFTLGMNYETLPISFSEFTGYSRSDKELCKKSFEETVLIILQFRDYELFKIAVKREYSFDNLYTFALVRARFADERINNCILKEKTMGGNGEIVENYAGLADKEKIEKFFSYFEDRAYEELQKYDCDNEYLIRFLNQSIRRRNNPKLEELKQKLQSVDDTYYDFVTAMLHYAKKKPERLNKLLNFLNNHPKAMSSDVVEFVSSQPDFMEDAAR